MLQSKREADPVPDTSAPFPVPFDVGVIAGHVAGVYARSGAIRRLFEALRRKIEGMSDQAERVSFPPVMARQDLERVGYVRNFPHLLGAVSCFCGDETAHRQALRGEPGAPGWEALFEPSDLVLTPAACYPVYPFAARAGDVGASGRLFYVSSWCFRREPSEEPGRLQSFEMHEYVRIGAPDQVRAFRQGWIDRAQAFFAQLDVPGEIAPANDPFFGRAAGVMANGQRSHDLKYEMIAPVGPDASAACMSFNCHLDAFGKAFDLTSQGRTAHTACVGFGLFRISLALFHRHGPDPDEWPHAVRTCLALDSIPAGR